MQTKHRREHVSRVNLFVCICNAKCPRRSQERECLDARSYYLAFGNGSIWMQLITGVSVDKMYEGLLRELSPGPLAPEARIMKLDQAAC